MEVKRRAMPYVVSDEALSMLTVEMNQNNNETLRLIELLDSTQNTLTIELTFIVLSCVICTILMFMDMYMCFKKCKAKSARAPKPLCEEPSV